MEQADIRTYFSKVDSDQRYICVKTKQPVMKQKSIELYFKTNENADSKDSQENKDNEAQPDENSGDNSSRVKKCFGYNPETKCWHCGECGANMGEDNPRQVCGKYACLGYGY